MEFRIEFGMDLGMLLFDWDGTVSKAVEGGRGVFAMNEKIKLNPIFHYTGSLY